jgi:hypothetical protein
MRLTSCRSFFSAFEYPFGQGKPPLIGPRTNGTPAREHRSASGLDITGLTGVMR